VSLQGFVLMVSATLSLDAVATFSTVRTLTRSVIQAGGIVNNALMPEMTLAFGSGNLIRVRQLIWLNFLSVVVINIGSFTMLLLFGKWLVAEWTGGRIVPSQMLLVGLAAVASLHSLWLSNSNMILAVNRHAAYAYWFLIICILSVIAAFPTTMFFGLNGALIPLIAGELAMIVIVERAFRATFNQNLFMTFHEDGAVVARALPENSTTC